ncbi:uncharacterized protein LOC133497186 [Syngnathoides biaculeatus]|uniref:uncharacterized protein LOC133497186 n=1 Tax=Syngnathoides biaculeatus TaxID=300417 RepID=UPI002ADD4169|nr:uncharacterized protein LOC133497186 [Syngnathoides biaculeatus]
MFLCSEQVSARIVQEVTAEAVAVLKGEQESQRLPSVEDTTNLPPSPPPSPAAEQFGPLEQDVGDEEEAGPLRRFQNSRERCKFLAPSISVSVPEDDPYHSDEEYYEHPLFSPEWTHSGARPMGQAVVFRQIEEETMEALTAEYERRLKRRRRRMRRKEEEQAEAIDKAQDLELVLTEAASAPTESSMDREEDEDENEDEEKQRMRRALSQVCPPLCAHCLHVTACPLYMNARYVKGQENFSITQVEWQNVAPCTAVCKANTGL